MGNGMGIPGCRQDRFRYQLAIRSSSKRGAERTGFTAVVLLGLNQRVLKSAFARLHVPESTATTALAWQ
jgi:hypothetical protein